MEQINWVIYAEIAYVNFGWSPDQFWRATPADFWCAYEGWKKMQAGGEIEAPLSRNELNNLVSRHAKS